MNAFPAELLHHHFACMVVAGLTPPSKSSTSSTTAAAAAVSTTSTTVTPTSTSQDNSSHAAVAPPDHPTSVFPDLAKSLHDILASRARNALWDPSRGRSAVFHTVFADHWVRLPPLKTKPSARHVLPIPSITSGSVATPSESSTAAFSALPPRSPLSPLHPNSPQFPDGLIAPVWVRKHRELIPSVFVSFHCLPTSDDIEELHKVDESLVKLVSELRRSLTERGIKLTIVLLTQRETLDDPQLEARLSFIRRNSGLDSKASLFVLTPVTKQELGDFVTSLHSALFEPAADYYREHARRVKRKRTRYPPPPSTLQPIVTALGTLPPATQAKTLSLNDISWLSREGWIVRSEYKLAVFAELAGDMQEAALRYTEAYDLLCNSPTCLLGSTMMLPPRTKRWAEAKVLADTLSVRICKLLLYADDGQGAAVFFRKHLARFTDLSTGWGIGAMTFEYWSWLAKQYRMFGELVEHATRPIHGAPLPPFQLVAHAPPLPSRLLHPDALARFSDARGEVIVPPDMLQPNSNAVSSSIHPGFTLQPPGAYYYLAALCTLERRSRFLRASSQPSSSDEISGPLAHERKVDHTAQLTEILTKAYDAFKRARQHRNALFVAARIATAYYDGGQHEMALKFLERITRSYGKDGWGEIRETLMEVAVGAAVEMGDKASAVRLLLEVLDSRLGMEPARRWELVEALKRFLLQSNDEGVRETDGKEGEEEKKVGAVTAGFLDVSVVFATAEVEYGAEVAFQVVVRNTSTSDLTDVLSADRLTLHLQSGDEDRQLTVEIHAASSTNINPSNPLIVELGQLDFTSASRPASADLGRIFSPAHTIVFQGAIKALHQGPIRVCFATVHVSAGPGHSLDLDLPLFDSAATETSSSALQPCHWLLPTNRILCLGQRSSPSITLVRPKQYSVSLTLSPPSHALYIDEQVPLTIAFHNHESSPLYAWIDAILQPSYDGTHDTLTAEPNGQGQTVKSLPLGAVGAGEKRDKVLWLTGRQATGLRVVDVHVRVSEGEMVGEEVEALDVAASTALGVGVEKLFDCKAWIEEPAVKARERALLDFDDDSEEEEGGGGVRNVGLDVEMVGNEKITVTGVELVNPDMVVPTESSEEALGEWMLNDRFSFTQTLPTDPSPLQDFRITWSHPDGPSQTTLIPIPPAPLPPSSSSSPSGLMVTFTYPATSLVLQPLPLHLTLYNSHPTHSLSIVVSLDSDEHFTLAASRRLSIPYLLPGQSRVVRNLARLVPQGVGLFALPNVVVRIGDSEGAVSVASAEWNSVDREGEQSIVFRYSGADGARERLPSIRVTL